MEPNMPETREERMQQRLRGAQRRNVKEVDFGLSFPIAPAAVPDVQLPANSQPEIPAQPTSRVPTSLGGSRPRSIPLEDIGRQATQSVNDANTSAKRRKLASEEPRPAPSSSRSTRSLQIAPRPDIYALPGDGDNEEQQQAAPETTNDPEATVTVEDSHVLEIDEQSAELLISGVDTPRLPQASVSTQEMILESPANAPGSGHRILIDSQEAESQNLQLQDVLQTEDSQEESVGDIISPTTTTKRKRGTAAMSRSKRSRPNEKTKERSTSTQSDQIPTVPVRRSARKSGSPIISAPQVDLDVTPDVLEEAEEIDDEEAATVFKKNRGRRISRSTHTEVSPELDEPVEEVPAVAAKEKATKTRPVSIRPSRRQSTKAISIPQSKAKKKPANKPKRNSNVPLGSPVPVKVYRFTDRPLYDDNERDAEILNSELQFQRKNENVIDVLNQVREEVISQTLETLQDLGKNANDAAARQEYRIKKQAVAAFGEQLETRLIEHTSILNDNYALKRRVAEAQKEKLRLRREIAQVREQREKIALQMDEVRIKHENETRIAEQRNALNNSIHDIEVAVERGKAASDATDGPVQKTGIELLVKRVTSEVGSKSRSGGLLQQINDFNDFLERAALALEARAQG